MDCLKKVLKVVMIIVAVVCACVGIYMVVKKFIDKKNAEADSEENYVSCSCVDA